MNNAYNAKEVYAFLDLKLRLQDAISRFHCISMKIINLRKNGLNKNIELRNIYFDNFENGAVELSCIGNEITELDEGKKQELFLMASMCIRDLPSMLKIYIFERLALNIVSEKSSFGEIVNRILYLGNTKNN